MVQAVYPMQQLQSVVPPPSLEMKVQLYISCRKLKDLDVFSKSDPIVHMCSFNERTRSWVKMGETELINNNLNPDFKRSFEVNYSFEK